MMTLITGGHGNLANSLKKYVDGDYLGKDMLDLTDRNCVSNLPAYETIIHTATGNRQINENLSLLFSKSKRVFAFTSKQGTYLNWKKTGHLDYGLEKLNLNFIAYRHNLENHNVQLIEPGHMETPSDYEHIAEKFSKMYVKWDMQKNQIYDLVKERYIPY